MNAGPLKVNVVCIRILHLVLYVHVQCVVLPVPGLAAGAACCLGMDWEEMGLSVTQVPHLPLFLCITFHVYNEFLYHIN